MNKVIAFTAASLVAIAPMIAVAQDATTATTDDDDDETTILVGPGLSDAGAIAVGVGGLLLIGALAGGSSSSTTTTTTTGGTN